MDLFSLVFANRPRRSRTKVKQKRVRRLRFEACEGRIMMAADLTAYRPQETSGSNPYAPFVKTQVPAANETDPKLGPGIRIDGDNNNANLIEVTVAVPSDGGSYMLTRGNTSGDIINALHVWTSATKGLGKEISFDPLTNKTSATTFPAGTSQTVWVEWTVLQQGLSTLTLQPAVGTGSVSLRFHSFSSVTLAIGGETFSSNPPPPDPTYGVWNVGTRLYDEGYDVYLANEGYVSADYSEIKNAIQNQGVTQVAIFGYSHGGGDTYTLASTLNSNSSRSDIGKRFTIAFTGYVDAIMNSSNFDTRPEALRPPGSLYHVNYYRGSGILSELFIHGVATQGAGVGMQLNVQTILGTGVTHTGATGISLQPLVQNGLLDQITNIKFAHLLV